MTKVLDHGYVKLVDSYGDDTRVVQAARVSYQKGTKQVRDDLKLIEYLIKHEHSSPLEMIDFTFEIKCPIFVARQLFRHRMGSYNEQSLRYSEASPEFYMPAEWRGQDSKNKQASLEKLDDVVSRECNINFKRCITHTVNTYHSLLNMGASREMARMVLPVNLYTAFYWKVNARSLANFIKLRDADGAQYEIREYAKVLKYHFKSIAPIVVKALEEVNWYRVPIS